MRTVGLILLGMYIIVTIWAIFNPCLFGVKNYYDSHHNIIECEK